MCRCCKQKVDPKDEIRVMGNWFIIINAIQSVGVIILCALSVSSFSKTNIGSFLPVDVISLFISVIILCFIIVVVGWTSAINNTGLGWIVYHCCMGVLIVIEVVISISTANFDGYMKTFEKTWETTDDLMRSELQSDLTCCGYLNITDRPALPCPSKADTACITKMRELFLDIRWVTSTSMFVCFIAGLFIDLAGYAMCVHPDVMSLEEQQHNDEVDVNMLDLEENFGNPFVI